MHSIKDAADLICGVKAQLGQKIYNVLMNNEELRAMESPAAEKLSPDAYKQLIELTAYSHPKCSICPHSDEKLLIELSCGHGCCQKCAQNAGEKRCRLCDKRVTVQSEMKPLPRSKLLLDRKAKLDNNLRLALLTNEEYGQKLFELLFQLNSCIDCKILQRCQRVLSKCGHLMCQECLEKRAEYREVLGMKLLAKSKHSIECPTCKVRSQIPISGFARVDTYSRFLYIHQKYQKLYDMERIKHPLNKFDIPKKIFCSSCEQSRPAYESMFKCVDCDLDTPVCLTCIGAHEDTGHESIAISNREIRQAAMENLWRLYQCADQYVLGILKRFEDDFHPSQYGSHVERIVSNRNKIASIYEGITVAPYVIQGTADAAVRRAEIYVRRLREVTDVVNQEWPRLREDAKNKVVDVLNIPSDDEDEEDEEEVRKSPIPGPSNADVHMPSKDAFLDDSNRCSSMEILAKVENILDSPYSSTNSISFEECLEGEKSENASDYEVI
ncbi:hypothetical protein L596_017821 [Steinernema carpocapsae]|uniref:RING-type domain-containing protein n=1 Tax=Steinernema carpocapsae TaxID=34508 RepID=A0A4U5N2S8_STECR|nr:hypothetical protein L596_017821 [Steinernema carpocapsae]